MLIIAMLLAGVAAGLGCQAAHTRMRERTYLTPVPRYVIGVALALIPWSLAGMAALGTPTVETVVILGIGIWYVFGCGGFATWLAYEEDRPHATEADARRFATFIAGEHDDAPERGD
jgi:uncharacterized membrane protein